MGTFDVQTVQLDAPFADAFRYLADPTTLPDWTHAFSSVDAGRATMMTPQGVVEVGLCVDACEGHGTIDWIMTFPNGTIATARSRLIPHRGKSIYTFVLEAPPLPLEELEGTLAAQSRILADELAALAARLASGERRQTA